MGKRGNRKFKVESFRVDGNVVEYEIRVDDNSGEFSVELGDGQMFVGCDLADVRKRTQEAIDVAHRQVFDPYIEVDYLKRDRGSRWDNHDDGREEVGLEVKLVWRSREASTSPLTRYSVGGKPGYVQVRGSVDPDTLEPVPLGDKDRRRWSESTSGQGLITFTPERWRRLQEVQAAIRKARAAVAELLDDASGGRLDALATVSGLRLLGPDEADLEAKLRGGSPRRPRSR